MFLHCMNLTKRFCQATVSCACCLEGGVGKYSYYYKVFRYCFLQSASDTGIFRHRQKLVGINLSCNDD